MSSSRSAGAIARAIKGRREQLVMQNHLCVAYPNGAYKHLLKLSDVKDAFTKELKKYGTDYSDIGTIHFVDEEADLRRLIETGVIDYAFELKKQGIIRNVAFSSHTPAVARKTLDAANFDVMFFGINAGYDYEPDGEGLVLSRERTELYRECARRGMGITVMKAYGNGQLLDAKLSPFGRAMTTAQCLQYVLDRPGVTACLAGANTAEEMRETLRFFETTPEERDYSFIGAMQKKDMTGACVGCGHCRDFCPFHVDMPEKMQAIRSYFEKK